MSIFDRCVYHNHTRLETLFGSSCTTINTDVVSTPIPNTQSPITTPITIPSTTSITPSSISTTQSTSTQPNGSITILTITQTPSPTNTIATDDHDNSDPNIAAIVGGTVGGFFGLIAIVALIWFILRRRKRWDDIFEKEEDDFITAGARGGKRPGRFSLDVDPEPKPYQYGLVGHALPPTGSSPPTSPPIRPSVGSSNINHARNTSLTPLNPSNHTVSSRPSTGSSQQPLYPPQQGYVPPLPQQAVEYASDPSTTLTHNHSASTASFMSAPVSHAHSHWGGGVGPGYNDGMGGIGAAMMGLSAPVMIPDDVVAHQDRSGTPTSIQEPRRLQVTNALPSEFDFDFGESSSSAAAAAAAAAPLRDGKGRLVMRTSNPPVVHVDGGRVPDAAPVATTAAAPSRPPAYTN
ncbi:hypothetical protein C0991_005811 [Blastosporella zonata]|nr:hypothetical protein C0991_005811 [Blastosporella zonata]